MRARAIVLALAVLAGAPSAAATAGVPAPLLAAAQLQGFYRLTGVVTRAVNVPGEHRGQLISRTWAFIPSCPTGPCATVTLVRRRSGATDTLILTQRGAGLYSGAGAFLAPARCGRRRYRAGELAPFTITVQITAVAAQGTSVIATGLTAFYRNPRRFGLTRCFSAPSYDSARYVAVPPAAGATRSVPSTRSSTAS